MSIAVSEKIVICAHSAGRDLRARPIHVLLFDLLPTVPYYTGHLSAALSKMEDVEVTLGSATYTHDKTFFQRMRLRNTPGVLDVAYRVRTTSIRRGFKLVECLLNMAFLAAQFAKRKPDVIHVQFTPLLEHRLPFELWFLKIARNFGIRVIYTVHNILPHEGRDRLRATYRKLYGSIDQFICHDVATKDQLAAEFGVDLDRVSVIPHGPLFEDSSRNRNLSRSMLRLPNDTLVILWQGIIRPYKGVPMLLRAWKKAREAGLEGILAIVGTGDENAISEVRAQVESLGIASSVHLNLNFVSVEELAAYHEAANILVYPYSAVTTSGALMTGVGFGKAIIASNLPAFQQVLQHETNALLVSPKDVEGWANALVRLAADGELRVKLAGELVSGRATKPSWDEIAAETLRVYRQLTLSPSIQTL